MYPHAQSPQQTRQGNSDGPRRASERQAVRFALHLPYNRYSRTNTCMKIVVNLCESYKFYAFFLFRVVFPLELTVRYKLMYLCAE